MNRNNLRKLYFHDPETYRNIQGGLANITANLQMATQHEEIRKILSKDERMMLSNLMDRVGRIEMAADEVEQALWEDGWNTQYTPEQNEEHADGSAAPIEVPNPLDDPEIVNPFTTNTQDQS